MSKNIYCKIYNLYFIFWKKKINKFYSRLDNVKYVGHKIVRYRFDRNKYNGESFSIKEIQNISNDMSQYLDKKNINGKILTSMQYGNLGWRSGKFTDIGDDDVRLYTPADSNIELKTVPKVKSFVIYSVINPKAEGGNDIFNDCLYNGVKYTNWKKFNYSFKYNILIIWQMSGLITHIPFNINANKIIFEL